MSNMTASSPLLSRRNILIMCCLTVLLAGVYWMTYSGNLLTSDEAQLFDGVESLVRRQNIQLNLALSYRTMISFPVADVFPAPLVDAEPMQILAGALLFRLAEWFPGVGLLHTVWLLNVLVAAVGGGLFFLYARALAYSERVAIAGTLLYGLGTIVWPYSKTFFREPLAMVLLFAAALCLNAWRDRWGRSRSWMWLAGFLSFYLMGLLTKEAALLSIPIIIGLVIPDLRSRPGWRRLVVVVGVALLLLIIGVIVLGLVLEVMQVRRTYNPLLRIMSIGGKGEFVGYAFTSYLFSPGRSLFAFSPILLLGIPGVGILLRRRRYREAAVPLLAVFVFVAGYAVIRHEHWFGGLSWGPRYLVPSTPLALLAVLPILQAFEQGRLTRWGRWAVVLVAGLSIWVQLYSILPKQDAYFEVLNRRGVIAWEGGTWHLDQSPFVINPGLLGQVPLDFAWVRVQDAGLWLPVTAAGVIVGAGLTLWWWRRHPVISRRGLLLTVLALGIGLTASVAVGLRSIYRDPRYLGQFDALHGVLDLFDESARPGDILVLPNTDYQEYMMNYYRNRDVPVFVLKVSPGEQSSPEMPPVLVDTNPDRLIEARTNVFLSNLPEYTDRIWLFNNSGPYTGFTVRPVEWFMARHYFPVQELKTDESARLILYAVDSSAPPDQAMRWPQVITDARFGEVVELVGFDLPAARWREGPFVGRDPARTFFYPGEVVPLSLLWRALDTPALDYNVGLFVLNAEGSVVAQRDRAPQDGFRPMNTWRLGETVRDNHGLQLPPDLPPGTYQLWVKVYAWQTQEPLPVAGDSANPDGETAFLTVIQVEGSTSAD